MTARLIHIVPYSKGGKDDSGQRATRSPRLQCEQECCVPQPTRNVDSHSYLRWPRVLASAEAAIQGTFCVVAEWQGAYPEAAGASGAVAAGRGQPGGSSGADMATGRHVGKNRLGLLRSIFRYATLRHARHVEIPGPRGQRVRDRLHPAVNRRTPASQPASAVRVSASGRSDRRGSRWRRKCL